MKISKTIAHKSNYGGSRKTSNIKFIVIHYTGNDGDTDSANAKYFQTANRGASAHYFVDDDSVTQSVPDTNIAWHCGTSGKYYHSTCRNTNSIGVEMCDTVKDGTYNLSKKTRLNVIELVQSLMKKYNIPIKNVVRHYDVTHKNCPAYFVKDEKEWIKFKNEISGKKEEKSKPAIKPSKPKNPFPQPTMILKRGMSNEQVRWLKFELQRQGYSITTTNGDFGQKVEMLVKEFQKSCKITVDGIVGKDTVNALIKNK